MEIILNIFSVIAVLIIFLLLVALLVKKEYTVVREVIINKPLPTVFDYVKIMKNNF